MPTALIIDDLPANIHLLEAYLRLFGIKTIGASTGKKGFELAVIHNPDVVFMDLLMPEHTWNGYKTTQELKAHSQTADIPIVAITAVGDEQLAYEVGCDIFCMRPFQKHTLSQVLNSLQILNTADCA